MSMLLVIITIDTDLFKENLYIINILINFFVIKGYNIIVTNRTKNNKI